MRRCSLTACRTTQHVCACCRQPASFALSALHLPCPHSHVWACTNALRRYAQEVQGKGYLSKAADMYSFGVLLWEMFHGMPPYAADNGHLVNNASFPRFDLRHREDAPFSYVCVALACLSENYEKRCA